MQNKKGQNEMMGFAVILVIVAVALVMFLVISAKPSDDDFIENYEVEAFIQSFLEYTTDCAEGYDSNYLPLRKVLFRCMDGRMCYTENVPKDPCDIFERDMEGILENNWNVGEGQLRSGYLLNITDDKGEEVFSFSDGNKTGLSKGASQSFEGGIDIVFIVYG